MRPVVAVFLLVVLSLASAAGADDRIGVLLMHGKLRTAQPDSPVGLLATALEAQGFLVAAPDMPWSRTREYDKTYEEAMQEIDARVEELRRRGARRVVVGGHSMGANAALGYGARRAGLAGILAIAPGHVPEQKGYQDAIDNDWKRAAELVESGNGDREEWFKDLNQGRIGKLRMRAAVYLSWFDPQGPAVMPDNAARLNPGTPLLWVVGKKDGIAAKGRAYAYDAAPPHAKNAYVLVDGGHKVTAQTGEAAIIAWLKTL